MENKNVEIKKIDLKKRRSLEPRSEILDARPFET